jgi:hypothetical protein
MAAADNIVPFLQLLIDDRTEFLEECQRDLAHVNEQIGELHRRKEERSRTLVVWHNIGVQRQKKLKDTIDEIGDAIHDKIERQDKTQKVIKKVRLEIEGYEEARRKIVEGLPIDNKSQEVIDEARSIMEREEARQRRANRGQGGRRTHRRRRVHRHRRKRSTRR